MFPYAGYGVVQGPTFRMLVCSDHLMRVRVNRPETAKRTTHRKYLAVVAVSDCQEFDTQISKKGAVPSPFSPFLTVNQIKNLRCVHDVNIVLRVEMRSYFGSFRNVFRGGLPPRSRQRLYVRFGRLHFG